jgi:hypothetical protein
MATLSSCGGVSDTIWRPSVDDLTLAPELGVLAALDATLATAAYQLMSQHPELGLDALARGHLPSEEARNASLLLFRIAELRATLRDYRDITLGSAPLNSEPQHHCLTQAPALDYVESWGSSHSITAPSANHHPCIAGNHHPIGVNPIEKSAVDQRERQHPCARTRARTIHACSSSQRPVPGRCRENIAASARGSSRSRVRTVSCAGNPCATAARRRRNPSITSRAPSPSRNTTSGLSCPNRRSDPAISWSTAGKRRTANRRSPISSGRTSIGTWSLRDIGCDRSCQSRPTLSVWDCG